VTVRLQTVRMSDCKTVRLYSKILTEFATYKQKHSSIVCPTMSDKEKSFIALTQHQHEHSISERSTPVRPTSGDQPIMVERLRSSKKSSKHKNDENLAETLRKYVRL
jgi:hypothetical protein